MTLFGRSPQNISDIIHFAKELRAAQRAYMADRGNEALGAAVGEAARKLDEALDE